MQTACTIGLGCAAPLPPPALKPAFRPRAVPATTLCVSNAHGGLRAGPRRAARRSVLAAAEDSDASAASTSGEATQPLDAVPEAGGGDNGSGGPPPGGDGGGDGEGSRDDDDDEYLDLKAATALAAAKGIQNLPADFIAAAGNGGLRLSVLQAYIDGQGAMITGWLIKNAPWFRNRLLLDPRFLFKVAAEVLIDSGCATIAEVSKRGEEFWDEFEFYLSDLFVGIVLDVVLVGLMAPSAVLGRAGAIKQNGFQKWLATVPTAVASQNVAGKAPFTPLARVMCLFVKAIEYGSAGFICGLLGQGVANSLMMAKRNAMGATENDVTIPPLLGTAGVWALFMGLSSNIRYNIVFGLERIVDLTIARRVPALAYGTTVAFRFANNVVGGMNFIDMARWAGVQ